MLEISETLRNAVECRDLVSIKSSFYTIILSDPAFKTGRFDEALEYLKDKKIEDIMEKHDGEELKPEEEWNEEYFDLLASKLQDNFSEERIKHIKQVAKKLYESTAASEAAQKVCGSEERSRRKAIAADTGSDDYKWIGIIGTIAAVLLMLKHLFKRRK